MAGALYYIPFAHRDWLSSSRVRRMPLAAQGAFVSLLCYQWEDGGIPAGAEEVARVLGVSAREMAGLWAHLEPAFPVDADGMRRNPRLAREREEISQKVERNRKSGAIGGRTPKRKASSAASIEGDLFGEGEGSALGAEVHSSGGVTPSPPSPSPEGTSPAEGGGRSSAVGSPSVAVEGLVASAASASDGFSRPGGSGAAVHHGGVGPVPPSPSCEGTSPTFGGGRSSLVGSPGGAPEASVSLCSGAFSESEVGVSGKRTLPFRLSENEAKPETETEPEVPEPTVPAGGEGSAGDFSGNRLSGNGGPGTGNGVRGGGSGAESEASESGSGSGSESVHERVRRTLVLVARGTGLPEPSAGTARRFTAEGRGLAPLLRRVEPEEAAALYLWCGRHFPGGKSWGTIGDHLGIYRRQMREGVTSLYGAGAPGTGGAGTGASSGFAGSGRSGLVRSGSGAFGSGRSGAGRMSLEEQMREARDAE